MSCLLSPGLRGGDGESECGATAGTAAAAALPTCTEHTGTLGLRTAGSREQCQGGATTPRSLRNTDMPDMLAMLDTPTPHTNSGSFCNIQRRWPFSFQQISSEDNLFSKDPCKSVNTLVSSSYMETLPTSPNILQNYQTSETCLHYTQRITTS